MKTGSHAYYKTGNKLSRSKGETAYNDDDDGDNKIDKITNEEKNEYEDKLIISFFYVCYKL